MLTQRLADTAYIVGHRSVAVGFAAGARLWHALMKPGLQGFDRPVLLELQKRFVALLHHDIANASVGHYPRELLFDIPSVRSHLRLLPAGLLEMPRVWRRARGNRYDDLPERVDRRAYPSYYLRNFHWQSDGWLSDYSADMYDVSVEFLFMGAADIMRRMAIPPLTEALEGKARPRVLDVACGTGRFLQQLHKSIEHAQLFGLDLSPNYIRKARRELHRVPDLSLVRDNAEQMPFADASFDALTSVYLFHELPRQARRNVMREAFRVLAPGGRFVVCDSGQSAGNASLDVVFDTFPQLYHEPYYKGYYRDDLATALTECGFTVTHDANHLFSRVVAADKPA